MGSSKDDFIMDSRGVRVSHPVFEGATNLGMHTSDTYVFLSERENIMNNIDKVALAVDSIETGLEVTRVRRWGQLKAELRSEMVQAVVTLRGMCHVALVEGLVILAKALREPRTGYPREVAKRVLLAEDRRQEFLQWEAVKIQKAIEARLVAEADALELAVLVAVVVVEERDAIRAYRKANRKELKAERKLGQQANARRSQGVRSVMDGEWNLWEEEVEHVEALRTQDTLEGHKSHRVCEGEPSVWVVYEDLAGRWCEEIKVSQLGMNEQSWGTWTEAGYAMEVMQD
tara:strand:- start:11308 stop:12168 length:861 start_codon:yes stop_codon:yes gene_type:complete